MKKFDKRTKEYKEWKNNFDNKSAGLGDTIEKITKATGIKKVVKFISGDDCGCDKRKDKLNLLFPSNKPECLKENEYKYLISKIGNINSVTIEEQKMFLKIYNRVFNERASLTSCSSCFINGVYKRLETLLQEY